MKDFSFGKIMTNKKQLKRKEELVCCDEETNECEPCEGEDGGFGEHDSDGEEE